MEFVLDIVVLPSTTVSTDVASSPCDCPFADSVFLLALCLLLRRREMGSNEMTRGFGWKSDATSISS